MGDETGLKRCEVCGVVFMKKDEVPPSIFTKRRHCSQHCALVGRYQNPENRKIVSERSKRQWQHPEFKEKTRKRISEGLKNSPVVQAFARQQAFKLGKMNLGRKHSAESRANMSRGRLGSHRTEETKNKMRLAALAENNAFFGRRHSEETKKKIGESCKGHFCPWRGQTKENSEAIRSRAVKASKALRGHKKSEEWKHKIAESNKRTKNSPEWLATTGLKMLEFRKQLVVPKKDTSIEVKVQEMLKQLGMEFFTHSYINILHGYQCDLFVPALNLIIECDGDYWHGNPAFFKDLNDRQKKQRERDVLRTKELNAKGYNVLRLWECDIRKMNLETFAIMLSKYPPRYQVQLPGISQQEVTSLVE